MKALVCFPPPLYRSNHTSSQKRITSKGEGIGSPNTRLHNCHPTKRFKATSLKLSRTSRLVASSPHTPHRLRMFSIAEQRGVFSPTDPIHGSNEATNIIRDLRNSSLFKAAITYCSICKESNHDE